MTEHNLPHGRLFIGLLIGGAIGAVAGILFAPKSGKELRAEIREKGSAGLKDSKELLKDVGTKASQIMNEGLHQATELKKDVDRHFSEARQKTKEILVHGEEKHPDGSMGH
jgi:gas vesicle protein